jgi:hypothetical protein
MNLILPKMINLKTIPLYLTIGIISFGSCNNENETDYRDKYSGNYEFTIYNYSLNYDGSSIREYYDTISLLGRIDKFYGYTTNNGSNYFDVEHKIFILFGDTSNPGYSSCNEFIYSMYPSSMHPTVSNTGVITYPEFTCGASDAYIIGEFVKDSINMLYGINYNTSIWHTKISGRKY